MDSPATFGAHIEITPQRALLDEVARCSRFISELERRAGEPWETWLAKERRRLTRVTRTCRQCGISQQQIDEAAGSPQEDVA